MKKFISAMLLALCATFPAFAADETPADTTAAAQLKLGKLLVSVGEGSGKLTLDPIPVTVTAAPKKHVGSGGTPGKYKAPTSVKKTVDEQMPGRLCTVTKAGKVDCVGIPTAETHVIVVDGPSEPQAPAAIRTVVDDFRSGTTATATASSTAGTASVTASATAATAPAADQAVSDSIWYWRHHLATNEKPGQCIFSSGNGEGKPPFCSTFKVVTPNSGETKQAWISRVSDGGRLVLDSAPWQKKN